MPLKKNRGKILRRRTVSMPGGRYKRCEVYEKKGPQGGKVVCGPTRKKKPAKRAGKR